MIDVEYVLGDAKLDVRIHGEPNEAMIELIKALADSAYAAGGTAHMITTETTRRAL